MITDRPTTHTNLSGHVVCNALGGCSYYNGCLDNTRRRAIGVRVHDRNGSRKEDDDPRTVGTANKGLFAPSDCLQASWYRSYDNLCPHTAAIHR
jgi:hypothetical protein